MTPVMPWVYQRRDPISVLGAVALALLAIWAGQGLRIEKTAAPVTEMTTILDIPEPPAPPPPTPAAPTQPPLEQPEAAPTMPQPTPTPPQPEQTRPVATAPATAPVEHAPAVPSKPVALASAPPPAPVPVPARAEPAKSALYESQLLAYVERIKHYPTSREARQTHPTGTVKVWLELTRQGQLLGAGVLESSGSNLLDNEATRTLRAGTFPPFPDEAFKGEASHRFSASLVYVVVTE